MVLLTTLIANVRKEEKMTKQETSDKEILDELRDQRSWWESQLEKAEAKVRDYKAQVAKVTRLISLLECKTKEDD